MDNIIVGQRINAALALRNAKQKELAKQLGVKDNVVSYWCNGSRTPNTAQIIQIAEFLDISADYLLGLSDIATNDIELKTVCEYTGLDERAIEILRCFDVDLKKFVNDMVYFAEDNKYTIPQFFLSKDFLLSCYEKIKQKDDPYDVFEEWKNGNNDEILASVQFRLQSAFNYYVNDLDVVCATKYFNAIENKILKDCENRDEELDLLRKIAKKDNFEDLNSWFCANKNNFTDTETLKKWLTEYNINISDNTANFIMFMLSFEYTKDDLECIMPSSELQKGMCNEQ